jgi:hypothetical protein
MLHRSVLRALAGILPLLDACGGDGGPGLDVGSPLRYASVRRAPRSRCSGSMREWHTPMSGSRM